MKISFFFRKKNKNYLNFFLHISSSYAKILGETNKMTNLAFLRHQRGVKNPKKSTFFCKKNKNYLNFFFCIYLLVMPKYWGKQTFTNGRFPEVGRRRKKKKKKKKKKNVGENNGQLRFVRHHVLCTQARLDQFHF